MENIIHSENNIKSEMSEDFLDLYTNDLQPDIYSFIDNFGIIQVAIGTIIGFSANNLIKDLSNELIMPIINTYLLDKYLLKKKCLKLGKIDFDVRSIIGNVIYLILLALILFIIFRYILYKLVEKIIVSKKKHNVDTRKYLVYNVLQNDKLYHLLSEELGTPKPYFAQVKM